MPDSSGGKVTRQERGGTDAGYTNASTRQDLSEFEVDAVFGHYGIDLYNFSKVSRSTRDWMRLTWSSCPFESVAT